MSLKDSPGRESHWGSSSYRDAWTHALAVVGGLDGMWLRDLRTAANTRLGKVGIRLEVRKRFLGHTVDVHGGYDNVDADDLRAAAEALRLNRSSLRSAVVR